MLTIFFLYIIYFNILIDKYVLYLSGFCMGVSTLTAELLAKTARGR